MVCSHLFNYIFVYPVYLNTAWRCQEIHHAMRAAPILVASAHFEDGNLRCRPGNPTHELDKAHCSPSSLRKKLLMVIIAVFLELCSTTKQNTPIQKFKALMKSHRDISWQRE